MIRENRFRRQLLRAFAAVCIALCSQLAPAQTGDLSDSETDPVKLFERGQDAHAKNDYQKAIDLYEAAIKLKPEFPEAELQRAMALLAINKKADALEGFKRAVTLRPNWPLAYSKFGTFLGTYDATAAEALLRRAIELNPKDETSLVTLAEIRARAGDRAEGLSLARSATALPTANAATWRKRALIEKLTGDKTGALASIDRALAIDPGNPGARYERATLRLDTADQAGAFADLQLLEQAGHARELAGAIELAQLYTRAGKRDEAIRILDALSAADKARVEVVILRGEIMDTGASTGEERAALEKMLAQNPKNASLLARLGSAYRRIDAAKSFAYYDEALKLEPRNITYAIGYAAALNQLRRFADAETVLRRVLSVAPAEYTAHANLAIALYEQKRFADAIPEYEWLALEKPEIAATYFFIATAHDNLGAYQQALDAYQQFLSHADPDSNKLEIEKVNLRLPSLRAQIQRGQGSKQKKP